VAFFDFFAGLLTVSLKVAIPTFVFPNVYKLKSLEARVGIEPKKSAIMVWK